MRRSLTRVVWLPALGLVVGLALWRMSMVEAQEAPPHYLRVSIGHWSIDTYSPEAERIFRQRPPR